MRHWNFPSPLYSLFRGTHNEITVFGELVLVDHRGLSLSVSEAIGKYPARSCLKPFQFLANEIPTDRWDREEPNRYIVAMGSVSATESQVKQLSQWYASLDQANYSQMVFSLTAPLDEMHRCELKKRGEGPNHYCHSCFSKHRLILETCVEQGWDSQNYFSVEHPYHQRLSRLLSETLSKKMDDVEFVADGCLLPSPVLSLSELAESYRKLCVAPTDSAMGRAARAMHRFPEWIGGPGRVDTRLMQQNPGKVIAKEGADGLLAVGCYPSERFPEGAGLVVKIASGYQPEFAMLAMEPLLKAMGLETSGRLPKGQTIHYHYRPFEKSAASLHDASPVISEKIAVWPGDVPFQRRISLATQNGDHMTLSSVETTLHVGTHADGLIHFSKDGGGIDSAVLSRYFGLCQVVEVKVPRGHVLHPDDLKDKEIRAKRVLIRTESFPDPNRFNEDFVSLSPEFFLWLGQKQVELVGIDTPSVDHFSSKTLSAHQASKKMGIAILEGLVLRGIAEGLYELSALPLPLANADASPVRVVLKGL